MHNMEGRCIHNMERGLCIRRRADYRGEFEAESDYHTVFKVPRIRKRTVIIARSLNYLTGFWMLSPQTAQTTHVMLEPVLKTRNRTSMNCCPMKSPLETQRTISSSHTDTGEGESEGKDDM